MQKRKSSWTTGNTLLVVIALVVVGGLLAAIGQIVWIFLFEAPPFTVAITAFWLAMLAIVIWRAKRSERENERHNPRAWSIAIIVAFAGGFGLALAARDYWLIPTYRPDYRQNTSDEFDALEDECRDFGSRTC